MRVGDAGRPESERNQVIPLAVVAELHVDLRTAITSRYTVGERPSEFHEFLLRGSAWDGEYGWQVNSVVGIWH
jgi:hypothetical protein